MKKILNTWNTKDGVSVKYDDGIIEEYSVDWYFLVSEKDSSQVIELCSTLSDKIKFEKNGKYIKIFVNDKNIRYNIVSLFENNNIRTFEGDMLLDKRWYIDNDIEIGDNFSKLYYDIETDDTDKKIVIGGHRIVSFAAIDSKGKKYFATLDNFTDEAEEKLLLKFARLAKKYDILLGWNTSEFDKRYIQIRMDKYNIPSWFFREVANYDLLKRFRHIFRFDSHIKSFSLDYVSKHFLDKGKIEHTEKIIELWKNNPEKLKEYNIEDCILVKELDDKLGVSDMMIRQCQWCKVPPSKFGLYSIIDSYILRKAHSIGEYCPTSMTAIQERDKKNSQTHENPSDTSTEKSKYTGAAVLDPKIGKYDNVYTFDFKGLYPSMMRTSNIGYDSLRYVADDNCIINPGTSKTPRKSGAIIPTFFDKKKSVINLAISDLITKRTEYKDLKLKMIEEGTNKGRHWERVVSDEIIVKELANSTYGIMGLEYGRYYSVDIAESITLFGQWCLEFAKSFFQKHNYDVIYGDTDSVFVSTGKEKLDTEKYLKMFHEELREILKLNYNIDESFIQLNFDKSYDSFILIAKKTYVGHVVNIEGKKTDDIYARGLEYHKKNTFSYAAKKQKELIEYILFENPDKNDINTWALKCYDEYYQKNFDRNELVITQRVGRSSDDYKNPPLHVKLAQEIKEKTGVDMHRSELDYIITGSSNGLSGVLSSNYTGEFDRDYYWENKTKPVLERITSVVFPGIDAFNRNLTLF